jgi:hypothetical protein
LPSWSVWATLWRVAHRYVASTGGPGSILGQLKPSGAVRDPKKCSPEQLDNDRLTKLLRTGMTSSWTPVAIWGIHDYRRHAPALHAQARRRHENKPDPAQVTS